MADEPQAPDAGAPKRPLSKKEAREKIKADLLNSKKTIAKADDFQAAMETIDVKKLEAQVNNGGKTIIPSVEPTSNDNNIDDNDGTGAGEEPTFNPNEFTPEPNAGTVIPDEVPDPLDEAVIQRDYTKGNQNTSANPTGAAQTERVIPEPTYTYTPPPDPKAGEKATGSTTDNPSSSTAPPQPTAPPFNEKADDLSPGQKRKAAEKGADAILLAYGNVFPAPFKWLASFNMAKMKRRETDEKLSLGMIIMEDGTTVKQFCDGHNYNAEQTFVVTEQMKQELREPLIDVLLENNVVATPMQRLLIVVGGHILIFGQAAVKMHMETRAAINQIEKLYRKIKNNPPPPPPYQEPPHYSAQNPNPPPNNPVHPHSEETIPPVDRTPPHREPPPPAPEPVQKNEQAVAPSPVINPLVEKNKNEPLKMDEVLEAGMPGIKIVEEPPTKD